MKVLALTNLFPSKAFPRRGVFNLYQFEQLSKHCELTLLVPVPWLERLRIGAESLTPSEATAKLNVHYFSYPYLPKTGRRYYGKLMSMAAGKAARRFLPAAYQPDAVVGTWLYPDGVATRSLAKHYRVPYVLKAHGTDVNLHLQSPERAEQIVDCCNEAAQVFCVSRDLMQKLIQAGVDSERASVLYNGIDRTSFAPQNRSVSRQKLDISEDDKIVLYVGNLYQTKGVLELVEAMASLKMASGKRARLVCVGQGWAQPQMETLAKTLGISSSVQFLGSLDHELLPIWINAANLVCLPSHSEGVPNVLLEAMACGLPVVATSVGGIPEVVSADAGLLVASKDSVALAAALSQALDNDWDASLIVQSVSHMNWKDNVALLTATLEQAIV